MPILQTIERLTGIKSRADQMDAARGTIRRAMNRVRISDPATFLRAIQNDVAVYHQVVNEITIGETYFFREPKQYEFIRHHVIDDFRSRMGKSSKMRVWSAACASGEEAYSVAILCDLMSQPVSILGTDIAPDALSSARLGVYRDWSFRGEAMTHVKPYVVREGDELRLKDSIKKKVQFHLLNLAEDVYPSVESGTHSMDLILCRNVLIYFSSNTVDQIGRRLHDCLRPGGWLIAASGDPPLDRKTDFAVITTDYGTFYQRPLQEPDSSAAGGDSPAVGTRRGKPRIVDSDPTRPWSTAKTDARASGLPLQNVRPGLSERQTGEDTVTESQTAESQTSERQTAERPPAEPGTATEPTSPNAGADAGQQERVPDSTEACLARIRSAEQTDLALALDRCAAAIDRHPLSNELHYVRARLLMEADRLSEASQAAQKALFLDRSVVMVHFLFGSIELQRGQLDAAHRHFRNARQLCDRHRPDDVIAFSDDVTMAELAAILDSQLTKLSAPSG